jgi:indolepyruvate ferredoxin oxidoreductase
LMAMELPQELEQQVARYARDLSEFEDVAFARAYLALVHRTAARDRSSWNWAATRAVVEQAFRVMAIKDEVYVSHLLTRHEKAERDRQRFGIDAARGDRIIIRHFNRPEFVVAGRRWRADIVTRDWQLRLMRRLKFLRRWWPGWHAEEQAFRDWYLALARRFEARGRDEYDVWVTILQTPAIVRGYRERRYPLMHEARHQADQLMGSLRRWTREREPA